MILLQDSALWLKLSVVVCFCFILRGIGYFCQRALSHELFERG